MHRLQARSFVKTIILAIVLLSISTPWAQAQDATPIAESELQGFAGGLTNGRSFTWSSDGNLIVATAGIGGDTAGTVDAPVVQVVGTLYGGKTAAVVSIEAGCPVTVASELASTRDEGGVTVGAASVAFVNEELYVLIAGGGVVHGNPDTPNGVYRIGADGSAELVADISAFVRANPVEFHDELDYSPEGDPYAMSVNGSGDGLWVLEANSGQLLKVDLDGTITRVADFSQGNQVPTALTLAPQGGVYVGFLTPVPFVDGTARVVHVAEDGNVTEVWKNLTMLTAVAVDSEGTLYGLEFSTGNKTEAPFFVPGTGKIVRQTGLDTADDIVTNLTMPNFMAFGPDDLLYVGLPGIGANSGEGIIARFDPTGTTSLDPVSPPVCAVGTPDIESSPIPEASPFE